MTDPWISSALRIVVDNQTVHDARLFHLWQSGDLCFQRVVIRTNLLDGFALRKGSKNGERQQCDKCTFSHNRFICKRGRREKCSAVVSLNRLELLEQNFGVVYQVRASVVIARIRFDGVIL